MRPLTTAARGLKLRLALVAFALGICGLATWAYTAVSAGDEGEKTAVEQLRAEPTGPGRFVRAYGLSSQEPRHLFTLGNGARVSLVETSTAKCLLTELDGGTGEDCGSMAAINEGKAISVTDECSSGSENLMEITGLAPEGVASVRLDSSNGASKSTAVEHGAFYFEGTNPAVNSPYPTGITWIEAGGAETRDVGWPVSGDEFCIPAPE